MGAHSFGVHERDDGLYFFETPNVGVFAVVISVPCGLERQSTMPDIHVHRVKAIRA